MDNPETQAKPDARRRTKIKQQQHNTDNLKDEQNRVYQ